MLSPFVPLRESPVFHILIFRNNADLGKEFPGRMISMLPGNSSFFCFAVRGNSPFSSPPSLQPACFQPSPLSSPPRFRCTLKRRQPHPRRCRSAWRTPARWQECCTLSHEIPFARLPGSAPRAGNQNWLNRSACLARQAGAPDSGSPLEDAQLTPHASI
jgi:hypothetical protein